MVQEPLFPDLEPKKERKPKKVATPIVMRQWKVPSFTSDKVYTVTNTGTKWSCECYQFVEKHKLCSHVGYVKEKLGLVKPDTSGWKSGVQKAIRRGDLSLLKLSFGKLWEIDPKWLLWRLPILAGEETWQYTGQAGRISFRETPSREDVWKLLANITLHPKDKDAEGLRVAARQIIEQNWKPEDFVTGQRLNELKAWLEVVPRIDWNGENKQAFWEPFNKPDGYERETVITCKRRFYTGGMGGDRELMITIAWLTSIYGVKEPETIDVPREEDVEGFKELPWYVWDMHTGVGKVVFYSLKKQFQVEKEGDYVADDLWFNSESAKCDKLAEGSFWWPLMVNMLWKRYGRTTEEARRDWERWQPKVRVLVEKGMAYRRSFRG